MTGHVYTFEGLFTVSIFEDGELVSSENSPPQIDATPIENDGSDQDDWTEPK